MRPDPNDPDHSADEQAVAWVLHALEPDEETEFAEHLAGCARCAETVAETMSTLGILARAVPQVDPPPNLRARVLAVTTEENDAPDGAGDGPVAAEGEAPAAGGVGSVAAEGDAPVAAGDAPAADGAPSEGDAHASPGAGPVSEEARPPADAPPPVQAGRRETPPQEAHVVRLRRSRTVRRALVGIAAVLVVIVVGGLVAVNQSLQGERDAQIAAAAQSERVVGVLRDAGTPGAVHATLAGPDGAMVGMVVGSRQGTQVLSTGLGANRSDQVYVLWGLAGAQPAAIGTFDVSGEAPGVQAVPSQEQAGSFAGYAVSLEPGRTAPAAPTEIVASGQVGR